MTTGTWLLLAALAVLVLAGAKWGFGRQRLPGFLRPLADSGAGFVALGVLAGPQGVNLLTEETLFKITPLLVIAMGWIGFLYGTHLEWRLMRRYPRSLYGAGLLAAMVCFFMVAPVSWWALDTFAGGAYAGPELMVAGIVLGICAAGTAPAGVFRLSSRRFKPADRNALQFFAAVDDIPPVLLLAGTYVLLQTFPIGTPPGAGGQVAAIGLAVAKWLLYFLGLGAGLGIITHWLFPRGDDIRENSLILLGAISLVAGSAMALGFSPLLATMLGGVIFANMSPRKESAYGLLVQHEHNLYAVFLLVAGLFLSFDWGLLLLLAPVYLLARGLGKLAGGYLGWRAFLKDSPVSPFIGAGMMSQGGMAVALAVSFRQGGFTSLADLVTSVVITVMFANDLLGPPLAQRVLGRRKAQ